MVQQSTLTWLLDRRCPRSAGRLAAVAISNELFLGCASVYVQKSNTLAVGDKFPQSNKVVEPTHRLLLLALPIRHLKFLLPLADKGAGTGRYLGLSVGCQSAPSRAPSRASHPMPDLSVTYLLQLASDQRLVATRLWLVCRVARRTAAPEHNVVMEHSAVVAGALGSRLDVLRDHGRDLIQHLKRVDR